MSDVEAKSERGKSADLRVVSSAEPAARATQGRGSELFRC